MRKLFCTLLLAGCCLSLSAQAGPVPQADIHRCALKVQAMSQYAAALQQGQSPAEAQEMLKDLLDKAGAASPYAASFGVEERDQIIAAAFAEIAARPHQEALKSHQGATQLVMQEMQKCSRDLLAASKARQ